MTAINRLNGKTIVLTGATGGLGEALAQRLAEAGATLLLTARSGGDLARLAASLPGIHHYFAADIATSSDREALMTWLSSQPLDGLINNAGVGQLGLVGEQSATTVEQLLAINLTAPLLLCEALLPALRQRPAALLINIGSILGSIGLPGSALYGASKAGLQRYTEALRRELSDSSVAVYYCAPRALATAFNSDQTVAMNRALGNAVDSPRDVAEQILLRCQGRSRSYFFGWPEKLFVRLNALFPGLVDGAMKKQLTTIRRFAGRP